MVKISQLSDKGDEVLVEEEGDVLTAYKCPAGVWSIGTGLTAASGVVKPKKGMTITREESRSLRRLALARNYEPAVAAVINTERQHVFDGGVLFHWNTGAIRRASWVSLFLSGAFQKAQISFLGWNKGGGKVLPGLTKRRQREWAIIANDNYGSLGGSRIKSLSDFADHIHEFKALGYDVSRGAITTITAFQRDRGLKIDGLIGPATRATLQRAQAEKSAIRKTVTGGAVGTAGGVGTDVALSPPDASLEPSTLLLVGGVALLSMAVIWGAYWVWRHRGPAFAWLPEPVKDWFENRGIVLGRRVRT